MWLSRSRKLTINMGTDPYETYVVEATVGLGHGDIGYSDDDMKSLPKGESDNVWRELEATVLARLDEQLAQEVADAQELTINRKSFVFRATRRSDSDQATQRRMPPRRSRA
jgi:hypothetical protein